MRGGKRMVIKLKELEEKINEIKHENSLNNREIAEIMEMDYTYIFRLFKENANPGKKVISGIEKFCQKFKLNVNDYIFFE